MTAGHVRLETEPLPRFVRGSGGPCFVRQVSEMQPAGHWVDAGGKLECGPVRSPGPLARLIAAWVFDRHWVDYRSRR